MSTSPFYDSILKGAWTKNAQGLWVHSIVKQYRQTNAKACWGY